ncbi:hypothetical protein [Niallia sp. Man26]|uniref:hypothetical protein n=1 Tax=Niallia TaxID=2837506 RepID=UPI001EDC8175|nr:hypothetical protein [Niallia sp. Man26]UPO89882.1 hypothetical protein L8T27_024135 [Niallia sp. Man26]
MKQLTLKYITWKLLFRLIVLALVLYWYRGEYNSFFKEMTLFHQILLYISYLAVIHLALEIMKWKIWSKLFYEEKVMKNHELS